MSAASDVLVILLNHAKWTFKQLKLSLKRNIRKNFHSLRTVLATGSMNYLSSYTCTCALNNIKSYVISKLRFLGNLNHFNRKIWQWTRMGFSHKIISHNSHFDNESSLWSNIQNCGNIVFDMSQIIFGLIDISHLNGCECEYVDLSSKARLPDTHCQKLISAKRDAFLFQSFLCIQSMEQINWILDHSLAHVCILLSFTYCKPLPKAVED